LVFELGRRDEGCKKSGRWRNILMIMVNGRSESERKDEKRSHWSL
jgi:hypothetical protein